MLSLQAKMKSALAILIIITGLLASPEDQLVLFDLVDDKLTKSLTGLWAKPKDPFSSCKLQKMNKTDTDRLS